jgi:hypothetical protein
MDQLTADCVNFCYLVYVTGLYNYILVCCDFIREVKKTITY